jgi:uncharacterized membrane protein YoaK (UPF0700 family)
MLLLLAGVSGSIDAIGYLKLGHVLTANMTGTTVLLGIAAGQGKLLSAVRSLAALAGFMTGVAAGTVLVNRRDSTWVRTLSESLGMECVLVAAMAVFWLAFMRKEPSLVVFGCIVLSSVAMGMQSATIRHLKIPGIVTTYISGTITAVVTGIVKHFKGVVASVVHPGQDTLPSALETRIDLQLWVFLVYGGVAALTALLYLKGMRFLPLLPLVLILGVLGVLRAHREMVDAKGRDLAG